MLYIYHVRVVSVDVVFQKNVQLCWSNPVL